MTQKQQSNTKKRIFIVDDHPIVREGLITIVSHEKDFEVCGEADESREAFKVISKLKPDVVIIDITLKNSDGLELTKNLKSQYPTLPVIVLSIHDEFTYAERALRAGAQAYLMKEVVSDNIVTAIRTVLSGEIYVSNTMGKKLLRKMAAAGKADTISAPMDSLSDRELEIFRLIGKGHKPSKIAKSMHLSVKTVETYRARIKEKLNLADADELLRYAIQWVSSASEA
jgi:DNA-binding NarL/FixJ family response regulator